VPPIERERKPLPSASALLVSLLAAVLLSACGGSAAETTSTAATPPSDLVRPHNQTAESPKAQAPRQTAKTSPEQTKKPDTTPQAKPEPRRSSAPVSQPVKGCPPGLSDQVCRETANAKIRQEESPPHQSTEGKRCPDSLNKAECQALVSDSKTEAPKPESSSPTECPPALSAAQCAELEGHYTEATK
jgi:hypothetical protein